MRKVVSKRESVKVGQGSLCNVYLIILPRKQSVNNKKNRNFNKKTFGEKKEKQNSKKERTTERKICEKRKENFLNISFHLVYHMELTNIFEYKPY